jgi:hypothetical protein
VVAAVFHRDEPFAGLLRDATVIEREAFFEIAKRGSSDCQLFEGGSKFAHKTREIRYLEFDSRLVRLLFPFFLSDNSAASSPPPADKKMWPL